MGNVLKITALFILASLAFTLAPLVSLLTGHGLWPGLLTSAGVLCLVLFFFFFRALWLRRKEKKFIDGILVQEEQAESPEKQLSAELSKRWKEAVAQLKKSQLKLKGNPLYVLPWYMVIGESGSGKTTAIRNSKLSSTFSSQAKVAGVSGTRNCDWWFFEQAIIIDTAGRYTTQPDEIKDRDEWRLFLNQLSKYRKKEPLNGLVVTVSADSLLTSSPGDLFEEGRKVRTRTEELMQILGAKFPVYVLVTKCDLIRGMKEFADFLPPAAHDQAMGCVNQQVSDEPSSFISRVFETVTDRLKYFRLHLSPRSAAENVDPCVLLFPEEFGELRSGLDHFIQGAFAANVYREAPILRGVYFISARQSGDPLSRFVKKLGFRVKKDSKPPSDQSYFLRELFDTVLPGDRNVFVPTRRSLDWKLKTRAMGFSAWILAFAVLCGLLSFSFARTLSSMRQAQRDFAHAGDTVLSGDLIKDMNTLERFRQAVVSIEQRNGKRWLPQFGLDHCSRMESDAKKLYCKKLSQDFLGIYDRKMDEEARSFTDATPSFMVGRTVGHYARRLNLLENTVSGREREELEKLPQPDFGYLVTKRDMGLGSHSLATLENLYRHYLVWASPQAVEQEKNHMRGQLIQMAAKPDLSLKWMIGWCNENSGKKDITLAYFWGGGKLLKSEEKISPAYTSGGSEMILGVLGELETSLDDPGAIERKKLEFLTWYRASYWDAWLRFARAFHLGALKLSGGAEQLAVAKKISAGEGPYFAFLDKMAAELPACLDEKESPPEWAVQVFDYSSVRNSVEHPEIPENSGIIKAVKKKGLRMLGPAGKIAAVRSPSPEVLKASGELYRKYKESVVVLALACAARPSSFKLATDVFKEDPAVGESLLAASRRNADELKISFAHDPEDRKVLERLIDAPMNFLWDIAARKAACHLQDLWNETVLSEVQGIHDKKVLSDMLIGKEGYVMSFAKGPAAPFIGRDVRRGYFARTKAEKTIPFRSEFFSYLTRGSFSTRSEQSVYKVRMEGLPTDINPDAVVIPHVTRLDLECAAGIQSLENYNFPVRRTFEWAPSECGDVSLKISVGDLVLKKDYGGFRPFARFLKDFHDGQHTYSRRDFPGDDMALKRMGITFIKVKYKISGGGPVISLLNMEAGRAPEVIVSCSD